MQACVDWVLISFGNQVLKKTRPVRPVFSDYLSFFYDYDNTNLCPHFVEFFGKTGLLILAFKCDIYG